VYRHDVESFNSKAQDQAQRGAENSERGSDQLLVLARVEADDVIFAHGHDFRRVGPLGVDFVVVEVL